MFEEEHIASLLSVRWKFNEVRHRLHRALIIVERDIRHSAFQARAPLMLRSELPNTIHLEGLEDSQVVNND